MPPLHMWHNYDSDAVVTGNVRGKPAATPKLLRQTLSAALAAESHDVERWLHGKTEALIFKSIRQKTSSFHAVVYDFFEALYPKKV